MFLLFLYLTRPIISERTGPIFTKFSVLVDVWVEVVNLTFVLRSLKRRCSGNHFCETGESVKIGAPYLHSLHWHSTTDCGIATLIEAYDIAMTPVHRIEIW